MIPRSINQIAEEFRLACIEVKAQRESRHSALLALDAAEGRVYRCEQHAAALQRELVDAAEGVTTEESLNRWQRGETPPAQSTRREASQVSALLVKP